MTTSSHIRGKGVNGAVRTHYELPRAPRSEYELNPQRSWISVVMPEESVNLVFDPEMLAFGTGTQADYVAIGTTVLPDGTLQRHGLYSARVTGISGILTGVRYNLAYPLAASTPYTFSFDHFGTGRYIAAIVDDVSNQFLASKYFDGRNFWIRYAVTGFTAASQDAYLAIFAADGLDPSQYTNGFNISGFQLEAKPYATTFISGDTQGFPGEAAYGWLGSPHNSASFRLGSTRSGGQEVSLDELGLRLTEIVGLGMGEPEYALANYAIEHGSYYSCMRQGRRTFSLVGNICGEGIVELLCARQRIIQAISPLRTGRQPVRMAFQLFDCHQPLSPAFTLDALYSDGMDGKLNNHYQEKASVEFLMPDPFIYAGGTVGSELEIEASSNGTNSAILARDPNHVWETIPGAPLGEWNDIVVAADGLLYCLVNLNGDGTDTSLQRFDGFNWTDVATFTGIARRMAATPDGGIYVVGNLPLLSPPPTGYIVRYDVYTEVVTDLESTQPSGGGEGNFRSVAYHRNGHILAGGDFDTITNTPSGSIDANMIAQYNIETGIWTAMGTTPVGGGILGTGQVMTIAVASNGVVFVGGDFLSISSINILAEYNYDSPTQWQPVDTPTRDGTIAGAAVFVLKFDQRDRLYIGGFFNDSTLNNYTAQLGGAGVQKPLAGIAYYDSLSTNGVITGGKLQPIGWGLSQDFVVATVDQSPVVQDIAIGCDGEVVIAGRFDKVLGRSVSIPGFLNPTFAIYSPGLATFGTDLRWRQPEVLFAPNGYTTLPVQAPKAVEFGGKCGNQSIFGPNGGGQLGSNVPTGALGLPPGSSNSLFVGLNFTPTQLAAIVFPARTSVNVSCAVEVRPIIRVYGPGRLISIRNSTTGEVMEFRSLNVLSPGGLVLVPGEVLTIDLASPRPSIYSNVNPNPTVGLTDVLTLSAFHLDPGINEIDILINNFNSVGVRSPDTRAFITWRPRYESIDSACMEECAQ